MIHDKDYVIRLVKQFSEFLSRMLLGKNEGDAAEEQLVFETQMKDIFKMNFEELDSLTAEEIHDLIKEKEQHQHAAYFELLGHLFYFKFKEQPNIAKAEKASLFYDLWLRKSQIFSIPVMGRIGELRDYLKG